MKKNFKYYAIIWAVLLAVFNIVCFATPDEAAGMNKFGGAFWAGYIFITVAFVGQLICAYAAFSKDSLKKFFYNISLISVSYTGLVLTVIAGSLCMAIPNLPNWVGIIVCVLILAFNIIALVKAGGAAAIVEETDEKVKNQTQFVKLTTANALITMNRAKSETVKKACQKVYEEIRYSDPMSNSALATEEFAISAKMGEFTSAVAMDDADKASALSEEIVILIKERNVKCKALK